MIEFIETHRIAIRIVLAVASLICFVLLAEVIISGKLIGKHSSALTMCAGIGICFVFLQFALPTKYSLASKYRTLWTDLEYPYLQVWSSFLVQQETRYVDTDRFSLWIEGRTGVFDVWMPIQKRGDSYINWKLYRAEKLDGLLNAAPLEDPSSESFTAEAVASNAVMALVTDRGVFVRERIGGTWQAARIPRTLCENTARLCKAYRHFKRYAI